MSSRSLLENALHLLVVLNPHRAHGGVFGALLWACRLLFRKLEDDLAVLDHSELVSSDLLDGLRVTPQRLDLALQRAHGASVTFVLIPYLNELLPQRAVARQTLLVEDPKRHGDDREEKKREGQQPRDGSSKAFHRATMPQSVSSRPVSGAWVWIALGAAEGRDVGEAGSSPRHGAPRSADRRKTPVS